MNTLDVVLLVVTVIYAVGGFRHGAVVGALSFVGFFAGGALGAQIAEPVARRWASGDSRVVVAVVVVVVAALVGQFLLVRVGNRLRSKVTSPPARVVDNIGGAVLSAAAVLTVAWMIAVPIASAPIPDLAGQVRNSAVIRTVDRAMPGQVRTIYTSLRRTVDSNGFPNVLNALDPTRVVSVAPVDPALANLPVVQKVHGSVLKVLGTASSCNREIEGSSFVYAPHHLLTNAHVVAGTSKVTVVTSDGELPATVVAIDTRRDVAVLYVPRLDAPALQMPSAPAASGQNAIVLGYPQNGAFDVQPARIRDRQTISGQDIYGKGSVDRDIYTIRSTVRPGNSGGPLIDTAGHVLGIVFASALDSSDTGFVLTNTEVAADAAAGASATSAVSTGACD